ncbi:Mu-like prophage major head subunit gpT family protein [Ruegeria sp. ANG10]|uniref:Mu-like prophage major head subunit gpT family protein n=1 Tax=Ruegeria sp. ANG10 TaxID=3042467 RepID=UPI0034529F1A
MRQGLDRNLILTVGLPFSQTTKGTRYARQKGRPLGIVPSLLIGPPMLGTDADEILKFKRTDNDKINVNYLVSNQIAHRVSDDLKRKSITFIAD